MLVAILTMLWSAAGGGGFDIVLLHSNRRYAVRLGQAQVQRRQLVSFPCSSSTAFLETFSFICRLSSEAHICSLTVQSGR